MNDNNQHITNIRCMDKNTMLKYFNMSYEERLTDLQKYIDMGKIMEDTVVFPPGLEILTDFKEWREKIMQGPDLSYRGMGWSTLDPHMYRNLVNGSKRAEAVIDNLKRKKTNFLLFSFKKLLEKLSKISKKQTNNKKDKN